MDTYTVNRLTQARLNALTAKSFHALSLKKTTKFNYALLILTFVIPIFYFIPTYTTKGGPYETVTNTLGFILNIFLLIIAALYLILKIDEKLATHKKLMEENIYVANECQELLNENHATEEISWFFRYISKVDADDTLTNPEWENEKFRQKLYREALKELHPGDATVKCPICGASPFIFIPGSCQSCGNTPEKRS